MSIQEIVSILVSAGIEPNEAKKEVKMLIEHYCNYSAKDIVMGKPLNYEKLKVVRQKAELRAKTKQPIQYIIGKAYFMGNYYTVNSDVLIPRDETEIVVRHALELINSNGLKTVLDIGTGSGCIACTLSENGCDVTGCDISEKALGVAKKNAEQLYQKVDFVKSDVFSTIHSRFDLIISNPPYIPKDAEIQKEVQFEPKTALFTNEETGTEFYKKIVEEGKIFLNEGGYIVFELGIGQSEQVKKYFEQNGYSNITIGKDLAGIDRVISASLS